MPLGEKGNVAPCWEPLLKAYGRSGVRRCRKLSYKVWKNMDEEDEEKVALVISYQNFKYSKEFWRSA